MHWLYDLPLPLLAALLLAPCIAYALGAVWLVRRLKWQVTYDDNATAAALHAFIGVTYAVALGLLVVSAQGDYSDVEQAVVTEANATGDLYRIIMGLEPATRARFQRDLASYVNLVITDEWPKLSHGERSAVTHRTVDHLADDIYTFRPSTPHETLVYPQLITQVGAMMDARRMRVALGEQGVGPVTWTIVILGGLLTIGFAGFFRLEDRRAQFILTGMMAAVFGLMLTLLVAMDHPLWGSVAVDPGPFEQLRENWMSLHAGDAAAMRAAHPPAPLAAPAPASP